MNIFHLDSDPKIAAQYHCDKHVVKMILEAAQMLSTAHRMLDGKLNVVRTDLGRKKKVWVHPNADLNDALYSATHYNHPSNIWTRFSLANYNWHYKLFVSLCDEYTYRYGKTHLTDSKLREILLHAPANINPSTELTTFALAMKSAPECIDASDPVGSYRAFYKTKSARFSLVWTKRDIPDWYLTK